MVFVRGGGGKRVCESVHVMICQSLCARWVEGKREWDKVR